MEIPFSIKLFMNQKIKKKIAGNNLKKNGIQ